MKNKIALLLSPFLLGAFLCAPVLADELEGQEDWKVVFSDGKEMISNFSSDQFDDVLDDMQPGDSARFQVALQNQYGELTDWYMTNEVLKSLEDESLTASGGAYSYVLTYEAPDGSVTTLYNSDAVGGENYVDGEIGLHEATEGLEDFFYLDSLKAGEEGFVRLYVLLDGETQGNDYQDTLAKLQMNFAVELPVATHDETTKETIVYNYHDNHIVKTEDTKYVYGSSGIVKTGDETNFTVLYVIALVAGVLLLVVGIAGFRLRKQMKEGES